MLVVDPPVRGREDLLPVPGDALAEQRVRVLLAPRAAPRPAPERRRGHAPPGDRGAGVGAEEAREPAKLRDRLVQEALVADLDVALVAEQLRALLPRRADLAAPVHRHLPEALRGEDALSRGERGGRVGPVALAHPLLLGPDVLAAAEIELATPEVMHPRDGDVAAVPDDVDHLRIRVDGPDLGDDPVAEKRRLVADDALVRRRQPSAEEVSDRRPGERPDLLRVVAAPGPDRARDPEVQVFRVQQRPVERARLKRRSVHPLDVGALVALPEDPALPLAEDLGMGVEQPHQPGRARLRVPDGVEDLELRAREPLLQLLDPRLGVLQRLVALSEPAPKRRDLALCLALPGRLRCHRRRSQRFSAIPVRPAR